MKKDRWVSQNRHTSWPMRSRGCSSRLMALAGAWNDDLGPRRHMIPDCMSKYPNLHLMKYIAPEVCGMCVASYMHVYVSVYT